MDLGVAGKVALVTAASKGLGLASARALAADGAKVVVCARGERALRDAAVTIAEAGGDGADGAGADVLALVADVTDPDEPQRLVDATLERFGRLDILVANAGGPPPGGAFAHDDAAFLDAINANLLTSVRLVRAAVPPMRAGGWGRICCITSMSVKQPVPYLALSNTARTGLWAWAKTAAGELFPDGITLNLICPGLHATERVAALPEPQGPLGDPADFGAVVAFLCSQQAGFMTATAVSVDGGAVLGLL